MDVSNVIFISQFAVKPVFQVLEPSLCSISDQIQRLVSVEISDAILLSHSLQYQFSQVLNSVLV